VQRKTLALSAALLAGVVAADVAISRRSQRVRTETVRGDCFGPDSIVQISPRRIGALPLNLTVAEFRRRCASFGWTTTNGDESLDTAVVLTRPGLRVVGVVANLANEEGDRRPLQIDPGARVALWKVSGTHAVLPDGVPITATWDDLRRAYGPLGAFALNGTIYVTICRQPGIGAQMVLANPSAPINPENGEPQKSATIDSVLAGTRINLVEVSASLVRLHPNC
jgi:hypothetical protein